MTRRQLHLNAFLMSTGHHEASWRLPESDPYASVDLDHFRELARIAERGTFDSLFLADGPVLFSNVGQRPAGVLEPLTLLTALAVATEHIGLIATASTSYNSPYNLARRFASLDHISGGRAGWNIVTTAGAEAARNFGLDDEPAHATRYERAAEFLDVALKLWDSWEDDLVVADKAQGVWGDERKIHPPRHRGTYFSVEGALNVPRSPQGYPLLVQAGSSQDGKHFAARYAEAVFTAQQTLGDAQAFYADLKTRAREAGRDPGHLKILPGIVPVIGSTEAEARAHEQVLEDHIVHEHSLHRLEHLLNLEAGTLELDARLPADLPPESDIEGARSRYTLVVELARRERLTVRELIGRLGGGRGHLTFTGTPEQVADAIENWFTLGAADGFNIMPAVLPSGLGLFVDHVVPILRARGLFRTEYGPRGTLRDRYGLPRPANQHTTAPTLTRV
ncbi:LLM class flavin-dependent oxidoreductase [Streptomyces violascens]|uniref:Monooxygenase n=1 Tax=Streptomyces violascens TaxID=67381 RepID=A0ABQ3QUM0_9ACTN|nr:LLM class flavin-dependent oxidoreductase [Streptomyces violascens]GGU05581.1 monooxygenase [Streptomyces violascens]GHI40981.1 monooxygenase [Streptomyces violascens]